MPGRLSRSLSALPGLRRRAPIAATAFQARVPLSKTTIASRATSRVMRCHAARCCLTSNAAVRASALLLKRTTPFQSIPVQVSINFSTGLKHFAVTVAVVPATLVQSIAESLSHISRDLLAQEDDAGRAADDPPALHNLAGQSLGRERGVRTDSQSQKLGLGRCDSHQYLLFV